MSALESTLQAADEQSPKHPRPILANWNRNALRWQPCSSSIRVTHSQAAIKWFLIAY
jgi:hypothetical protein